MVYVDVKPHVSTVTPVDENFQSTVTPLSENPQSVQSPQLLKTFSQLLSPQWLKTFRVLSLHLVKIFSQCSVTSVGKNLQSECRHSSC